MSNNFKINLTKVNNVLGEDLYNGSIKLKDLFGDGTIEGRNFFVPVYNPHSSDITQPDSGYQREAKPKRVSDVMNRIVSPIPGTSIPNKEPFIDNVNLNILASDASIYVKPLKKNEDDFGDFFAFDYISDIGKFRVLDGQTRIKGALAAWLTAKENNDHQLAQAIGDTRVSITLSFCADIFKEAYIFYLINQYSKVIPPDGATRLLFEGVKKGKIEFVNEVTRADKETLIESMGVAEKLSKNSDVWAGHIKDFNESGGGKMSIRAVAKIIEPIYKRIKADTANSSKAAEDIVFDITEAYWSGIKLAYPMMFDPRTATKYNILKAGPSEIMMMVLEKVYDVKQGNAGIVGNLTDPKTFKKLMKATLDQHKDKNRDDIDVSAERLFLSGVGGALGKYSNNAAKKEASRLINRSLFEQLNIVTP